MQELLIVILIAVVVFVIVFIFSACCVSSNADKANEKLANKYMKDRDLL